MKIIKDYKNNEIKYDNLKNSSILKIELEKDSILIDFVEITNTQFTGGNIQNSNAKLRDFLKLGHYSKADCGGFVNFFRIKNKIGENYIIYSGINEVSNSHYIVTIHKIIME